MNKEIEQADDLKTALEHEQIILNYLKTGLIDREHAIKKYSDFNASHPTYYTMINLSGAVNQNIAPLNQLSDNDIVVNLNQQLIFLSGKNLLGGNNNA